MLHVRTRPTSPPAKSITSAKHVRRVIRIQTPRVALRIQNHRLDEITTATTTLAKSPHASNAINHLPLGTSKRYFATQRPSSWSITGAASPRGPATPPFIHQKSMVSTYTSGASSEDVVERAQRVERARGKKKGVSERAIEASKPRVWDETLRACVEAIHRYT